MKKPKFEGEYFSTGNWWFDVLSINNSTRRYCVNTGGWNSGSFKNFWLFRNALKYARTCHTEFVSIYDEKYKTSLQLRGMEYNGVRYEPVINSLWESNI